jgi:CRISPR-associated protein Cas5d
MNKSYPIQLEISGPTAMWTRPDTGDAPVSYLAPTYSAAKGVFESICWLKSALVRPTRIEICTPPVWHTYTTNYGGPLRKSSSVQQGNSFQLLATVLVNVCYRIYGEAVSVDHDRGQTERSMSHRTAGINGAHAYQEMFQRRLLNGQWFTTPCLGWKEFVPDYVGPLRPQSAACELVNASLPSMLHAVFSHPNQGKYAPSFAQNVEIRNGVLNYAQ